MRRRRPGCKDSLYGYDPTDVIRIGDQGRPGNPGKQGPPGRKGDPGAKGDPGDVGLSAYEVALKNGFVGSEDEWLETLEGAPGPKGDPGELPTPAMDGGILEYNEMNEMWITTLHPRKFSVDGGNF